MPVHILDQKVDIAQCLFKFWAKNWILPNASSHFEPKNGYYPMPVHIFGHFCSKVRWGQTFLEVLAQKCVEVALWDPKKDPWSRFGQKSIFHLKKRSKSHKQDFGQKKPEKTPSNSGTFRCYEGKIE